MVRQWQELFWDKRYSHTHFERQPDFEELAEAYGAAACAVTDKDQVADALREAHRRPTARRSSTFGRGARRTSTR